MFPKVALQCQGLRERTVTDSIYQVLGPPLHLIQPLNWGCAAHLTFQMTKKIQRLNNTLTKKQERSRDHLVYLGELGCRCKTTLREREAGHKGQAVCYQAERLSKGSERQDKQPRGKRAGTNTEVRTAGPEPGQKHRVPCEAAGVRRRGQEVWEL